MRHIFYFFMLLFLSQQLQSDQLDSLRSLLDDDTSDKYSVYCKLSSLLWEIDSEQSKIYAQNAMDIATDEKDTFKLYKAKRNFGMIYSLNREYDNALKTYKEILQFFTKKNDTMEVAALQRNIGDVYYRQSKFQEALKSYIISDNLFERMLLHDNSNQTKIHENHGATLNNIGNVYLRLGELEKSIQFFKKALNIQKKTGDNYSEAAANTNIGNIYHYLGEYQKALEYYKAALDCSKYLGNSSLLANIYQNIAATYQNLKSYENANYYYIKALNLFKETDNNDGLMEIYHSLAVSFFAANKNDSALHYFDIAENMAIKIQDYQHLSYIYSDKSEFYKEIGEHKKAYDYLKLSFDFKDSVLTQESIKQINELTIKYETEKKDNQLKIQELEMTQKEADLYILSLVIIVLTLIIILIFWLYRTKNRNLKLIEEKNVVIEQANIELEHQNDLILNQNQELSNLNSVKDKFFSIISHDMRNPVTNLTLLLSIIESYFQKGEYHKIPEKFEKFKQSINSLMYLFDNLLMWSRTQTGSMQFNKTKINLSQTLVSVAETFELNMETKNIELQIDVTDNILLEADKDMIEFVIRNLLSNSLKFTSPGGRVSISLENAEESVILSVADTGIGMSKESIEKLFKIDQKYSRVGTANEKGSGLGLTIVKEFTDLHQATIEIASNLGDGTTVRVLFPKTNILI